MKKKDQLLGMSFGSACHRLRKSLLFSFVTRLGLNVCYRCGKVIEIIDHLSIEHKLSWEGASDPNSVFFDLGNIAFSHLSCNIAAAKKPNKVYENAGERNRASFQRYYRKHKVRYNETRNERRRVSPTPL